MPLVAHSSLPAYQRLKDEGEDILSPAQARQQDIRELHVGFLNIMPDAAFAATERQFFRLIGSCNRIVQFYVHPFTLDGIARGEQLQRYVAAHYEPMAEVFAGGLDALIITGANVAGSFVQEAFWPQLCEVLEFATTQVTSTLCACLATHAALYHLRGIERRRLPAKRWGVYSHRPVSRVHPVVRQVNSRFQVPHSRHNDVERAQIVAAGDHVLVYSEQAGVHLAASADGLRFVFFQGHPEYDRDSLLKEYKREVNRWLHKERSDYPPLPEGYFSAAGAGLAAQVRRRAEAGDLDAFPEAELLAHVDNTWADSSRAVFSNWLALVYKITGYARHSSFMRGIDPHDPLGIRRRLDAESQGQHP